MMNRVGRVGAGTACVGNFLNPGDTDVREYNQREAERTKENLREATRYSYVG